MNIGSETELQPPARTNLQLYAELARRQLHPDAYRTVRKAYECGVSLLGYYYFEDGSPLLGHVVGTASLLTRSGADVNLIAAGLVYPAIMIGTASLQGEGGEVRRRRKQIRKLLGSEIETLVCSVYRAAAGDGDALMSDAATILEAAQQDLAAVGSSAHTMNWSNVALDEIGNGRATDRNPNNGSHRSAFNQWSPIPIRAIPPNSVRPTVATTFRRLLTSANHAGSVGDRSRLLEEADASFRNAEHRRWLDDHDAVAQDVSRLLSQLESARNNHGDVDQVRRSYALAIKLFSGRVQPSGRQFLAHVIGCASILAQLRVPIDHVCAGLLHNVYRNGDFGTALPLASPERRKMMSSIVGESCEAYLYEFVLFTRTLKFDGAINHTDKMSVFEKGAVLIYLVDQLEKMIDLEILYDRNASEQVSKMRDMIGTYCDAATALGFPTLSTRLRDRWALAALASVPPEFVSDVIEKNPVPLGFTTRYSVAARHRIYQPVVRRLRRSLRHVVK